MSLEEKLAEVDVREAAEPGLARWSYHRGVLYEEAGQLEEAEAAYREALARDPDHLFTHINLGRLLDDRSDWDGALALYDRAMTLPGGPEDDILLCNRANTYLSVGRIEDARAGYEAALAVERSASALRGLQTALGWLGRVEELKAVRPVDEPGDRGPFFVVTRPLQTGRLVVQFWSGRHTRPEWLLAKAEALADHVVGLQSTALGLGEDVHFRWGWSVLTVVQRGEDRVVCEPSYRNPSLSCDVGFAVQTDLMQEMLHSMVEAPPAVCTSQDRITLLPGALRSARVCMTRFAGPEGHSGWLVGQQGTALSADLLEAGAVASMGALVMRRHPLLKAALLPVGWTAHFEQHAVVSVTDLEGVERWNTPG